MVSELRQLSPRIIKNAGACYSLKKLEGLWGDYSHLTMLSILKLPIPTGDKSWVYHHILDCVPVHVRVEVEEMTRTWAWTHETVRNLRLTLDKYYYEEDES